MSDVLIDKSVDGVMLLTINRPERRNALSIPLRQEMAVHVNAFSADPTLRALVITGDDKAFAAGADLVELGQRTVFDQGFETAKVLWRAMEVCPKPIIAAVRGYALGGGCELMLQCDIIIAGENAKLGQPEVKVGIMPGAGGTQRILRSAGKARTMRWVLTGDTIDAATALDMGIISEIVPDDRVLDHALGIGKAIAALPPLAVTAIKQCVLQGLDASLPVALAYEQKAFQLLFASEDRSEGIKAFLERRAPVFKGV
jgi:enoyl-CoA hydratase/carnithine racemase